MTDIPTNEELPPTSEELELKLETLSKIKNEIERERHADSEVDSHFFHVSDNLLTVVKGYFDFSVDEERPLEEIEREIINKKLLLLETYLAMFEDPWFKDKELYEHDGAFSDGKVYSSEEYIKRAKKMLDEQHSAEPGLA